MGIAASTAALCLPKAPARAGWPDAIEIGIKALELGKEIWGVGTAIYGRFTGENNDRSRSQEGNVLLAVYNDDDEIEASDLRAFKLPRSTRLILVFKNGPAAKTEGDKNFEVAAAEDSDRVQFVAL
jgi:hypothetical protein